MNFGEKLKELRTKNNLTQQDLAKKMDISSKTIGRWEKENNIPDATKLKKLCKILKCNMEDLTGEKEVVQEKKTKEKKVTKTEKIEPVKEGKTKEKIVKEEKTKTTKETKKEEVLPEKEPKEDMTILTPIVTPEVEEKLKEPEKKEEMVKVEKKFTKTDRRLMHSFSRIISVVSRVSQVLLVIAMCLVGIVMVCLPALFNRIEIYDNMIRFEVGRDPLVLKEDEEGLTITYKDDKIFTGKISEKIYDRPILDIFKTNSKASIVWHIEGLIFIGELCLIAYYLIFGYLAKITKNIANDKVFDLNNVSSLRKMAYMYIALIVVSNVASLIAISFIRMSININISLSQVMLILCLFLLALIFKYGHSLENKIVE